MIRIGVGGGLRAHRPIRQAATLKEVQPLTADMAEFTFQTANPAAFTPGQYAMIHLPDGEVERAYSMSNVSNCHGHWRFVIKRTPNGHASSLLFDKLEPGATVTLDGPFGNAYLRPDDGRDIVCVGGGSGLGAMVSVVLGAAAQPGAENRTVHLFIGARNAADLVVPAPVEMAARRLNSLQIHTALSEEVVQGGGSAGNALVEGAYPGFVHEAVVTDLGESLESFTFYAAGPSAMTEQLARSLVVERGVDADRLHFDRFC
ncbi:toluene monooxygenase electron transfer component [Prauserella sediminis]|uniref:Toluene monooxygenase electron transfer component n=1 Tax=Prauserella sediminis TaxID=577680 RepID=A0A839XWT5_9PSEU|nr:FAD-binding oxidoreductase [Prauserella sediminis]MBB3664486.1 toluene monooxygenase electron transfer component [Prauserella sediminis]